MSGRGRGLAATKAPTFIDLFCGCGGFTLGMQRAGFRCLAAIDSNSEAIDVFSANFPSVPHILQKDLKKFGPAKLVALVGSARIDAIVGGPPCQGFSTARQVDWANHGSRVKRDKRRYLYREFLEYVRYFKPRVFVIENVLGIQSAAKGAIFTRLQAEARSVGYQRGLPMGGNSVSHCGTRLEIYRSCEREAVLLIVNTTFADDRDS